MTQSRNRPAWKSSPKPWVSYSISAVRSYQPDPGFPLDVLMQHLQERWLEIGFSSIASVLTQPLWSIGPASTQLAWDIAVDDAQLRGRAGPCYYAIELMGDELLMCALMCAFLAWYAALIPAGYDVGIRKTQASLTQHGRKQRVQHRILRGMSMSPTTTAHDIAALFATSDAEYDAERLAQATYHLRITRTPHRKHNKRMYRVERLEYGQVIHEEEIQALDVSLRLMVEGVPIHTDIKELIRACAQRGALCFPLASRPGPRGVEND